MWRVYGDLIGVNESTFYLVVCKTFEWRLPDVSCWLFVRIHYLFFVAILYSTVPLAMMRAAITP